MELRRIYEYIKEEHAHNKRFSENGLSHHGTTPRIINNSSRLCRKIVNKKSRNGSVVERKMVRVMEEMDGGCEWCE